MNGHKIYALFATLRPALMIGVKGKPQELVRVNYPQLETLLPRWWRQEAKSPQEWFVRLCRNLGFHATWDDMNKRFDVRMIKNDADAATVVLPGIDDLNVPQNAKGWGGEKSEG